MMYLLRLGAPILALLFCFTAFAETPTAKVFSGLSRALKDPKHKVVLTPDKSALLVISSAGDVSVGADGQVKVHSPGAVKRIYQLSQNIKGVNITMAQALGHAGNASLSELHAIGQLLSAPKLHVAMRRNEIGFNGRRYSAKNRPLDIVTSRGRAKVTPSGRLRIRKPTRGRIGFRPARAAH